MRTHKTMAAGALVVVGLVLLGTQAAQGQGVGNPAVLPSIFTYGPNGFEVSNPATGGPIGVVLDPNGPAWRKTFEFGSLNPQPGQQFTVHELLQVTGSLPWQDWHEKVLEPGWNWLPGGNLLANGVPAAGLGVSVTPGSLASGGTIDYTFNSLAPGTVVDVYKTLVYTGTPGAAWVGPVHIAEYPTPEPTTLGLLALSGLGLLRRRRANDPCPGGDGSPAAAARAPARSWSLAAVAFLGVLLAIAPGALAQGVGNLGSLPTSFATSSLPTGWTVASSNGPIPVVLDPNGPVWGKSFTGPNGGPFLYPPTSPSNPPLAVDELLQVAGNIPWTDWHEDVVGVDVAGLPDTGWTWANPVLLVGGLPAPGLTITGVGTSNLSFFFNPLPPGTIIDIRKQLVYTGTPGAAFVGTLAVHEYPTPEPTTLGLLALGGLGLLRRRPTRTAAAHSPNSPPNGDRKAIARMSRMPAAAVAIMTLVAAVPTARANLLVDGGFETNPLTTYTNVLSNFPGYQGVWGVEVATITGVDAGISPSQGAKMLRMVDDGLVATQAFQATDVTSYAGVIDAGGAMVSLSALFNAGPNVPAGASAVTVRFFSTSTWASQIGGPIAGNLTLDNNPATWEAAVVNVSMPVGTRWVVSEVLYNDASLFGNPGYVDAADLRVVPEPASLGLLALGGLGLLRRRRRQAKIDTVDQTETTYGSSSRAGRAAGRAVSRGGVALLLAAVMVASLSGRVKADNWDMYLTVDNQFDAYFGTPYTTTFHAGGGNNWAAEYHYTATGQLPTDYLYVATASDQSVAQGFLGTFTNTTTSTTINTGSSVWQVFPAGKYLSLIDPTWPNPWTPSLMPTQSQVDAAINFATINNLWVAPTITPGYDNDPSTPTAPYFYPWGYTHPNIPQSANWIWYNSGLDAGNSTFPAPINGFNHDEFLVFRVPGTATPEPASLSLLGVAGLALIRRRLHAGG